MKESYMRILSQRHLIGLKGLNIYVIKLLIYCRLCDLVKEDEWGNSRFY